MNRIVIVGAGQTGRGYINRLLSLDHKHVVFIDKDEELVDNLNQTPYTISFGNSGRSSITVNNYDAYTLEDVRALQALKNADKVFTAIGVGNLTELVKTLNTLLDTRTNIEPLRIITCENGVNVSSHFDLLKEKYDVEVSEAIVFCTTLARGLDILSEDLDWVPYDSKALTIELEGYGFYPEDDLGALMQRKIYTYNCLSAVVSYVGAYYDYDNYGEAANDERVVRYLKNIQKVLDMVIMSEYNLDYNTQHEFSDNALKKFMNKDIADTIDRNARDVLRKLAPNERIIAPLLLINKQGYESEDLLDVCAYAYMYGVKNKEIDSEEYQARLFNQLPETWQEVVRRKVKVLMDDKNIS